MSMRGLEMKRRSRVSTVSGIPKNVSPRATALMGRDFALAMPKLNAARTSACGLDRFAGQSHLIARVGVSFADTPSPSPLSCASPPRRFSGDFSPFHQDSAPTVPERKTCSPPRVRP